MNVVFVYPRPKDLKDSKFAPLGIQYLATILKREGIKVKIIDLSYSSMDELIALLRSWQPEFVCISISTALSKYAMKVVRVVRKESPNSKIVAGGPHATICDLDGFDFVVKGEGEKTLLDIIKGKETRPVVWGKPIKNLDEIPFPDKSLLDYKQYIKANNGVEIITSRGCPYNCLYCQPTQRKLYGSKVKMRSVTNVVEEIKQIKNVYGSDFIFFFVDDTFTWDREWILEFCKEVKPLNIVWNCNSRVNLADKEIFHAMKDSGCVAVAYGVETGNQDSLNFLRKGVTVQQIEDAFRITHESGMLVQAFLMVGIPGENDINDTVKLIKKIHPDGITLSTLTPLIGTDFETYCKEKGILNIDTTDGFYSKNDYPVKLNIGPEGIRKQKQNIRNAYFSVSWKNYPKYIRLLFSNPKAFFLYTKIFFKTYFKVGK
jgi:anaerobic magnesium-protoporphyrin IX monomethyl ester cyclase